MRVSKEAKAQSRAKIIDEAAKLFRANGIEATGVAQVMSAAGMTHGGFYRHFPSKEMLVSAAIEKATGDIVAALERDISALGIKPAITAFVDRYLSERHVSMREKGCPIAALASEVGSGPDLYGQALTRGTELFVALLTPGFDGPPDVARGKAVRLMVNMVGTIVLARSTRSEREVKEFLAAGRENAKTLTDG